MAVVSNDLSSRKLPTPHPPSRCFSIWPLSPPLLSLIPSTRTSVHFHCPAIRRRSTIYVPTHCFFVFYTTFIYSVGSGVQWFRSAMLQVPGSHSPCRIPIEQCRAGKLAGAASRKIPHRQRTATTCPSYLQLLNS